MSSENFYAGADYGLDPNYKAPNSVGIKWKEPASNLGVPTDPRTANQIKAVSDKLSTGVKTIEVSGITPEVLESIPNQHLDEISRLRQLTGVDLTFHGPIVEATGIVKQGWDDTDRQQVEKTMWSSVQRAHKLDPKGNVVVTFHSSAANIEPETKVINELTGKEEISDIYVVDEREGRFDSMRVKKNYFTGTYDWKADLEKMNKEAWFRSLQSVSYHASIGEDQLRRALINGGEELKELSPDIKSAVSEKGVLGLYKSYIDGKSSDIIDKLPASDRKKLEIGIGEVVHADVYLRDAYQQMQTLFNQAYEVLERENKTNPSEKAKEDFQRLEDFRKELAPKINELQKDPSKLGDFGQSLVKGVNLLRAITPPEIYKPLKGFAIDKASDTFSNIAINSYKEFKNSSPIISIENPPVGSGLSRAEDLREVVKESRRKFIEKAIDSGVSEKEAEQQAEKLIGATWDVGHINMMRKRGYDEKAVIEETKKIAPFVKHVHLSDNFGLDHTEMPMGMGNVPTKQHLELLKQYNANVKKIAETGNWFQPFVKTPLRETLEAFDSPLYAMKMQPYWNQISHASGGYFSGYGMNPDIHHSIYGAGFAGLPTSLGGQVPGKGGGFSGTPME
jgi:sugar phosphate isomerase/epimerase